VKPFEIFSWQPPGWPEIHPCVIVSHPDRADRKTPVEVLMCSTKRATRAAEPHEILLDKADGLDWPTLCKCDLIHAVPRTELKGKRGDVSLLRRRQLIRTLMAAHGWASVG
jgi:mRNA-degrading endonuclease toxin of MazEF toxin-antitoxin module